MEIEVPEYIPISNNDFIDHNKITDVSLSGDLIFKEIPIDNIEKNSIIISHLNKIIEKNNINRDNYNIYFYRSKEWFNKFIFYEKNKK